MNFDFFYFSKLLQIMQMILGQIIIFMYQNMYYRTFHLPQIFRGVFFTPQIRENILD